MRSPDSNIEISASIVTYNSSEEIDGVLSSFGKYAPNVKIIVIDNASADSTCEIVEQRYPKVAIIKSTENLGFGAAHNIAINKIKSKYHIIVNPDIEINERTIPEITDYMEIHDDVVIASPKIQNPDGSEQFLPKRNPSMKYLIGGRLESRGSVFRKWRDEYTLKDLAIKAPIEIDFCSGCFMYCRTNSLKAVGGFDTRYFLHFEDADLTRMMKASGRTMYLPDVSVTHKWHRENGKLSKSFLYALNSMCKYFEKWGS